ncbi:uncharacterized protein V1516DRAFT_686742 [Lipomyces oligophaga]|uniref:uncharacterized protein n=1 Tax=Lipomyces oligophaga TaxID=45792 RepID=UPI0034CE5CB4
MNAYRDEDDSARACDSCRIKKIKCDKSDPCSACVLRKVDCLRTIGDARKRRRIMVERPGDDFKFRLDRMQNQLDAMSQLLTSHFTWQQKPAVPELPGPESPASAIQELHLPSTSTTRTVRTTWKPPQAVMIPTSVENLNSLVANIKGRLQYLGKSSLLSMSIEAQLLTTSITDPQRYLQFPHMDSFNNITELITAAENLDNMSTKCVKMLEMADQSPEQQSPHEEGDCPGIKGLLAATLDYMGSNLLSNDWLKELQICEHTIELPPRQRSIELLDFYIQKILPFWQLCSFSFANKLKKDLYDPHAPNRLQIVACASYMMISSLTNFEYQPQPGDEELVEMLTKNVWQVLKDPNILVTATFLNTLTLLFCALCAKFILHPGLTYMLLTHAGRHAITLGLHRKNAFYFTRGLTAAEVNEQRSVFWLIYIFEKTLALTFGRTSCLPSYDMDIEEEMFPETIPFEDILVDKYTKQDMAKRRVAGYSWSKMLLRFSRIYDEIYIRLYSSNALKQSVKERRLAIKEIEEMLQEMTPKIDGWLAKIQELQLITESTPPAVRDVTVLALFLFNICRTMIHRVGKTCMFRPVDEESDESYTAEERQRSEELVLESSRNAIRLVADLVKRQDPHRNTREIISWCLVHQPFAPFFELFTNVIRTGDRGDLELLQSTTSLLKKLDGPFDCTSKLYQVADLFSRSAKGVVDRRMSLRYLHGSGRLPIVRETSGAPVDFATSASSNTPSEGTSGTIDSTPESLYNSGLGDFSKLGSGTGSGFPIAGAADGNEIAEFHPVDLDWQNLVTTSGYTWDDLLGEANLAI